MSKINETYHQLLEKITTDGYTYEDPNRKGVNRLEIPSYTFRHEFKDGFPAISTKKLHYKNVVTELIWFLRGDTNIKYLVDNSCNIWNKDAYNYYLKISNFKGNEFTLMTFEDFVNTIKTCNILDLQNWWSTKAYRLDYTLGDLGPVYGHQWRKFKGLESENIPGTTLKARKTIFIDQIQRLITNLKEKPLATDHIVNSWNVGDLQDMALPPCHYGFQIVVRPLNKIKCDCSESAAIYCGSKCQISQYGFEIHFQMRSVDVFLGCPYNIASYATLALILEKITGYKALAIQGDLKKVHLYDNSFDAVKEQLNRDVDKYDKCELKVNPIQESHMKTGSVLDIIINSLEPNDFQLENYESYPAINVEMLERDE